MRYISLLFSFFFLFGELQAQSSVWKAEKDGSVVYLGGTCHILRASDFPLPDEFDYGYEQSQTLVFEVDPELLQDPAFAMQLMSAATYQDNRTLKTVLSPEAYSALSAKAQEAGFPLAMFEKMKPGFLMIMLSAQELMKSGITQEGVDAYYAKLGKSEGKTIESLETPEFQMELIANLGEGVEDEVVLQGLDDLKQVEEFFEKIVSAWKSGNKDDLEALFVEDMKAYPEIYDRLLKDRNEDWLPKIEAFFESDQVEFVLVGVAHMVGEDGLVPQLRAKGYKVQQIDYRPGKVH